MHTLIKRGTRWEVGYWTPPHMSDDDDPKRLAISWMAVATLETAIAATHLVSYLNGGPGNEMLAAMAIAGKIKFAE